jgi:3-oxoacyl-[acyl-carrier protein] reductase
MPPTIDLELGGKTALITGCNNPHGIGAAVAQALAAQGAAVFLHYYAVPFGGPTPDEFGEDYYLAMQAHSAGPIVDAIRSAGGRADLMAGDLGDPALPARLFDAAEEAFGPVQVLINNAAYSIPDSLLPGRTPESGDRGAGGLGLGQHSLTVESIDRHFDVNTRATALMMAEHVRRHIERADSWGRIINVSTDAAHAHVANISYAASKHAIESYSRSAAAEMGKYGITVNIVAPGTIQTGYITPAAEREIAQETPLGRVGQPDDVAQVMLLLASEQAHWLTGQLLYVGGGYRMAQ